MAIKIAIIISIIMQVAAAIVAINLTRVAKYNISWILITIALLLMAFRRVFEYFPFVYRELTEDMLKINTWIGIATSAIILIGFIYIRKIFNMIKHSEGARLVMERKVLDTIVRTEEAERKRFAKDLHDGLGPLLSNLKMSVSALESIDNKSDMGEILDNMKTITNESLLSIREIANNLSPHILENFGLLKAIDEFVKKLLINPGLDIHLESNLQNRRYAYNTEIILYRVVTELFNNTVKHASASRADMSLVENTGKILLFYSDNGIGMELPADDIHWQGMGLSNIVSRIKSLHGTVNFFSAKNEGFRVKLVCPAK
ncbi:MAG: sensor histidine kinase [Bacteroidales bacterium]|nr:sensor histidine kinase [Bacteroidales bacterium]